MHSDTPSLPAVTAAVILATLLSFALAAAPGQAAEENCAWLRGARALRLTADFVWSASGSDGFGTATISRSWQLEATLDRKGGFGGEVEYGITSPPGELTVSAFGLDDVFAYPEGTDSAAGAGALSDVEVVVRVDSRTCAIDADFFVSGEVAFESPQASDVGFPSIGDVHLVDVVTVEEFLGGTLELPHLRDVGLGESHFFPGWHTSAEVTLMEAELGTASFTWSLEPVGSR